MKTLFLTSLLTATALMAQTGSAPAPQTSTPKATTTVKKSHHKKHGTANPTGTPASTASDATKAPAKK